MFVEAATSQHKYAIFKWSSPRGSRGYIGHVSVMMTILYIYENGCNFNYIGIWARMSAWSPGTASPQFGSINNNKLVGTGNGISTGKSNMTQSEK